MHGHNTDNDPKSHDGVPGTIDRPSFDSASTPGTNNVSTRTVPEPVPSTRPKPPATMVQAEQDLLDVKKSIFTNQQRDDPKLTFALAESAEESASGPPSNSRELGKVYVKSGRTKGPTIPGAIPEGGTPKAGDSNRPATGNGLGKLYQVPNPHPPTARESSADPAVGRAAPNSSEPTRDDAPPPVRPGAYPQQPTGHDSHPNTTNDDDISISMFTFYNELARNEDHTAMPNNSTTGSRPGPAAVDPGDEGLVQARRVSETLPRPETMEQAEPVDLEQQQQQQQEQEMSAKESNKRMWCGGLAVLLLGVIVVGLMVLVVGNDPSSDSTSSTTMNATNANDTETLDETEFLMDLLPENTQRTLRLDVEGTSPQARAYQWMRQDPDLLSFSNDRLLQRYALVVFYYANGGEEWKEQGGPNITFTAHLDGNPYAPKPNQQQPPPGMGGGRYLQQPPGNPSQGGGGGGGGQPPPVPGGNGNCPPPGSGPPPAGGPPAGCRPPPGSSGPPPGSSGPPSGSSGNQRLDSVDSELWLSYGTNECDWFTTDIKSDTICSGVDSLTKLHLARNNMAGTIPDELALLSLLEVLSVEGNQLRGTLPTFVGGMTHLESIRFQHNSFTGTIPSELGLLSDSLRIVQFMDNSLEGSLPSELWRLTNLRQLKITKNALTGEWPEELGEIMPHMEQLMTGNQDSGGISGALSKSLAECSGLQIMEFAGHPITGTIPTEFGQFPTITRLFLMDTLLTGSVPSELGLLPHLSDLWLHDVAGLTGTIPSELGNINSLIGLKLTGSGLTGTIPPALCNLPVLEFECPGRLCGCDCPCPTSR